MPVLIFVLALSISYGFAKEATEVKKGKVIINGHVQLPKSSSKVISLIYSQLSASPTRLSAILDSTGYFQFEFEILHPHDITLRYEKGTALLYVRPLDSLHVQLNSENFQQNQYPDFVVSGKNAQTSKDILCYRLFNKLKRFEPAPAHKTTEEYVAGIGRRIATEDSLLALFNLKFQPTAAFKVWAKKDIIYRNANYLVDFEYHHSMQKTTFEGILYDTNVFPVSDTDALVSSWYQYHLWQYATSKYIQRDSVIQGLLKEQKKGEAYRAVLKKITATEKLGIGRDIVCYQILYMLSEEANDVFRELMKNSKMYVSTKELTSILNEKMTKDDNHAKYHISFFKSDSKEEKEIVGDFMNGLISKHKGKIIYLDFWATWCGPCRSEVPYAIDLHNQYKNQPIVFVNLCLLSDREAWKNAIAKQKIAGENYFFDKDQSELLKSRLKLEGFPTYMIISKEGQIINRQAPRPSSGNTIKTVLTKLLE
ncbi:TlpA family protein disulfide reductase [Runella limosa]|uniref:TlpA family protein disulfide reductase n=1 Tax=Runella limosa TaxID=370978 RepID=UPI0004255FD3|nr:TlpA disulfide reductase family protein [Runella limosa]